jgi:hypothetical protein
VDAEQLPVATMIDMSGQPQKKYKMPPGNDGTLTPASLGAWVDRVLAGKEESFLRSDAAPDELENNNRTIRGVVGETFDKECMTEGKDVLLMIKTPW